MPGWGGILKELQVSAARSGKGPDFDAVRRSYLVKLAQHTGRSTVLYGTKFSQPTQKDIGPLISISPEDIQGLMAVMEGLDGPDLDLILHTPGGSLETAEAMVTYLRSRFSSLRVIVPHLAQSAGTIIACGADSIVMGKHSFLGPIDPQIILSTPVGLRMTPTQAILDQFKKAKIECQDKKNLAAWAPMLQQYGPDLLVVCENLGKLSTELVKDWLQRYMFSGDEDAKAKALSIAEWLGNHNEFMTHGRQLSRDQLETKGLVIDHLENDQILQDLVLSVFHAMTHTFEQTGCVKLIENQNGKAFIKSFNSVEMIPQSIPNKHPPKKRRR